jgi:MoaA/NifB/PqqE/SkfB family radical SAM enzyme
MDVEYIKSYWDSPNGCIDTLIEELYVYRDNNITSLLLTSLCEWDCQYCECGTKTLSPELTVVVAARNRLKAEGVSIYNIVDSLVTATEGEKVMLSGGEFSLLEESLIEYIFKAFEGRIASVATNGLFITKEYHIKYEGKYDTLYYHCVAEPGDVIEYPDLKNTVYIVLVHHRNITSLKTMLDKYPHINFRLEIYRTTKGEEDPLNLTKVEQLVVANVGEVWTK